MLDVINLLAICTVISEYGDRKDFDAEKAAEVFNAIKHKLSKKEDVSAEMVVDHLYKEYVQSKGI